MKGSYSVDTYIISSVIISFLGFCLENIWLFIRKGYVDNRNMTLPFLLGYSFAILGFYFVLGTPEDPSPIVENITERLDCFNYYAATFFLVSIGEIILGKTVERLCGIYYWDYSSLPLHITRYTSVMTSVAFSIIITGFMKSVYIPMMNSISNLTFQPVIIMFRLTYILMILDFFISFYKMYKYRSLNECWKKQFIPQKGIRVNEQSSCNRDRYS